MKTSFNFKIESSSVFEDVILITPSSYSDVRGNVWTSYDSDLLAQYVPYPFVQDKFSYSSYNVLRGIHGDHKSWKLISCPFGSVLSCIVDLREDSQTYSKHLMLRLSHSNLRHVLIPPGFGNSFYVESKDALYSYKLSYEGLYYDADQQFSVRWNDPSLSIPWPTTNPILSKRDQLAPFLK